MFHGTKVCKAASTESETSSVSIKPYPSIVLGVVWFITISLYGNSTRTAMKARVQTTAQKCWERKWKQVRSRVVIPVVAAFDVSFLLALPLLSAQAVLASERDKASQSLKVHQGGLLE